jgi:hypothetical protein
MTLFLKLIIKLRASVPNAKNTNGMNEDGKSNADKTPKNTDVNNTKLNL